MDASFNPSAFSFKEDSLLLTQSNVIENDLQDYVRPVNKTPEKTVCKRNF